MRKALARERLEFHGETLELPLPDGPGKALKLTIAPVQDRIPIYLAAIGPEEHRARRRDRRRLDPDASSRPSTSPSCCRCSRRAPRASGRSLDGFDIAPDGATSRSPTTSPPPATSCARSSRCTSAAWARASRTSTTRSCRATASRTRRARSRTCTSRASATRRRRALPDELDRHGVAVRPGRPRARAPRGLPRRGRRDARDHADGVVARRSGSRSCASSPSLPAEAARAAAAAPRRLRRPRPRVPDDRARPRARRARPRRRAPDVAALAGARRGRGHALRGGARVPRLPHARASAEAVRGGRAGGARHRARSSPRRARRDRRGHPHARPGARGRARGRAASRRSSPTSTRARAPGLPAVLARRAPAAHRAPAGGCGRRRTASSRRGLERGRERAQRDARPARPAAARPRPRRHLAGAVPRRDVPAARVPARLAGRDARRRPAALGAAVGRRRAARRATSRSCSSRRRRRRTPAAPAARRARGPGRRCPCGCWRARTAARSSRRSTMPANARLVDWVSYARTMPHCDVVVCHGGHGTLARALAGRLRPGLRARGGRHERERRAGGLGGRRRAAAAAAVPARPGRGSPCGARWPSRGSPRGRARSRRGRRRTTPARGRRSWSRRSRER